MKRILSLSLLLSAPIFCADNFSWDNPAETSLVQLGSEGDAKHKADAAAALSSLSSATPISSLNFSALNSPENDPLKDFTQAMPRIMNGFMNSFAQSLTSAINEENSLANIVEDDVTPLKTPALVSAITPLIWNPGIVKPTQEEAFKTVVAFHAALPDLSVSSEAKPFLRKAEVFASSLNGKFESVEDLAVLPIKMADGIRLIASPQFKKLMEFAKKSEKPAVQIFAASFQALNDAAKNEPAALRSTISAMEEREIELTAQVRAQANILKEQKAQMNQMMGMMQQMQQSMLTQNASPSVTAGATPQNKLESKDNEK